MTSPIISLNPKPSPQTTPDQPKSVPSAPKLLDKTAFPKKAPQGTRPPKREPEHGELGGIRRSSRRSPRTIKPEYTPKTRSSEIPQTSQPRTPRISADLERRFRNLELRQKNLVEQARTRGELEYLAVAKNGTGQGQYLITVKGTGKPFVREVFASAEFCLECAFEIEENFEILQVLELRPTETMERIEEMVGVWLERERVSRVWGSLEDSLVTLSLLS
ncbi:hypothetical protein [Acaryochloris sp. CCMEE 5410]|uniref:hypothetical protein n=1 Tax=Acaryochloris sp. CCMEE 5410 TaxID=310037 RepID=UPI0002483EB4|nr:hypothetical protein [Acaryochloris sp. CCMEE 5410]KAI9129771.1 hypothetical protein ON05_032050 [Acaryochloris sp. CCMEE 5410]